MHERLLALRSVIGAQFRGAIDLGWREKLALQVRVGWSHERADTARTRDGDARRRAYELVARIFECQHPGEFLTGKD